MSEMIGGSSSSYLSTPGTTTRSRSISQPQQHRPYQQSQSSMQYSPSGSPSHLHSSPMMNLSTSPGSGSPGSARNMHQRSLSRSLSNNAIQKVASSGLGLAFDNHAPSGYNHNNMDGLPSHSGGSSMGMGNLGASPMSLGMSLGEGANKNKGRGRSSSLVTVTEVGGDDGDQVVDRLGVGVNENANWVNAPGAWLIHPVIILLGKVLVDAIPNMTASYSWTIVNLGYVMASYTMFHSVTGVPFESSQPSGGAYDDLTLWEQIDAGAQYTPAKKWLTSVPILLFLISTHYVKYDPRLFFINFAACVFVLFPKLPALHRLRFHFTPLENKPVASNGVTPNPSRPGSPHPPGLRMSTLDPIMESRKA